MAQIKILKNRLKLIKQGYCIPSHLTTNYKEVILESLIPIKSEFKDIVFDLYKVVLTEVEEILKQKQIIHHNYYNVIIINNEDEEFQEEQVFNYEGDDWYDDIIERRICTPEQDTTTL